MIQIKFSTIIIIYILIGIIDDLPVFIGFLKHKLKHNGNISLLLFAFAYFWASLFWIPYYIEKQIEQIRVLIYTDSYDKQIEEIINRRKR